MSASVAVPDAAAIEAVLPTGLVVGHAYGVSGFASFDHVPCVKMYNPWGKQEWKGAWSDDSAEWERVPKDLRPENEDDGTFWMAFDDFCDNFDTL